MEKKSRGSMFNLSRMMIFILLGLIAIAGAGCSSSDSSPAVKEGVFLDGRVSGMGYRTPTQVGVTDAGGKFKYREGETITFFIGDILIGEAPAKPVMTPVDLADGAEDETHPTVTNIARFLQTIDDDADPENGIEITEPVRDAAVGMSLNFAVSITAFEEDEIVINAVAVLTALTSSGERVLVGIVAAQLHLQLTLENPGNVTDDDEDGFTENQGDCDDENADIYPGAEEICGDGMDQDCDGSDLICTGEPDADDDGDGVTEDDGDCDDTNPAIYPQAEEICGDGIDQNCDGDDPACPEDTDDDEDGFTENQGDCDDANPAIYPEAEDICGDEIDQNCDGTDLVCPEDTDDDEDGFTENQGDCDDANVDIHPEAVEICGDGVDQNCDGDDPACPPEDIDDDGDSFTENQGDCDDANPAVYPEALEICGDGIDQNCDGADLSCPPEDSDDDGDNFTENQGDCDDANPAVYPEALEICGDGIDQNCDGSDLPCPPEDTDDDGDGFTDNQGDCNDINPLIHPAAIEICGDGVDQDCDGTDLICIQDIDDDQDGFTENQGDCDDANAEIYPGAAEVCGDGTDQDCDGNDLTCQTDENSVTLSNGFKISFAGVSYNADGTSVWAYTVEELPQAQDLSNWVLELPDCVTVVAASPDSYELVDPDPNANLSGIKWETGEAFQTGEFTVTLDGLWEEGTVKVGAKGPDAVIGEIAGPACNESADDDLDGFSEAQGDCDDASADIHPDAEDVCGDGIDQNCDGTDPLCPEDRDDDLDGFSENEGDCDDANANIFPNAAEICGDGIDQDCDGADLICIEDTDNDADGFTENDGDCNDADPEIHPDAEDLCEDGIDQNCDGTDLLCPENRDDDGDGYSENQGDCNDADPFISPAIMEHCEDGIDQDCDGTDLICPENRDDDGDGFAENDGDCDDANAEIHPDAVDFCEDGIDQNCDGEDALCPENTDDDQDGFTEAQGDCDDSDAEIHPDAEEICGDGIDQNCDEADLSCDDVDDDGDGFTENDGDCDDTNADVYPGADEICSDGIDQDCDGQDKLCRADKDKDGDGFTPNQGDCDDENADISPAAQEICGDEIDQNCDTVDPTCSGEFDADDDGDGFTENDGDCDDLNAAVHPQASEICGDGIDQNCDGADLSCDDVDNDGDGFTENQGDCNDQNAEISPAAKEICGDGIDQNCDGTDPDCTDDADMDNDGDGFTENQGDCDDMDARIHPDAAEICGDGIDQNCNGKDPKCPEDKDDDNDGFTENQGDCDDANAAVRPDAAEICGDGIDQNCDGTDPACSDDPDADDDGDGFSENQGDCNDMDARIHPDAAEICGDGIDQNCNGADLSCDDVDNDGDGFTENQGDCDDANPELSPGADEICGNDADENCDGVAPSCEDDPDADNDGDGYTENDGDCDDMDARIHPDAEEICGDGVDQDCNGKDRKCDEDRDDDGDGYTENDGDCDDENPDIHPGAEDICGDDLDQNCDGTDLCPDDTDDDGDGYTENDGDCDDANPDVHPAATDICGDGADQDCDGVDPACSADISEGNWTGTTDQGHTIQFTVSGDRILSIYVNVDYAGDACTGSEIILTGNASIDIFEGKFSFVTPEAEIVGIFSGANAISGTWTYTNEACGGTGTGTWEASPDPDADGDGVTVSQGDCDDANPDVYPGAEDICGDTVDQDCDGADLACPGNDADADGDSFSINDGDCDDANPEIYPGATEICGDGVDKDCADGDLTCSDENVQEGIFLYSIVVGLEYRTETRYGITDHKGKFKYMHGESVTFFIGGIVLGTTTAQPVITPVDLVADATDESHPAVINICRLLMTLDDDDTPHNGILISQGVRDYAVSLSFSFNVSIAVFEADTAQAIYALTAFRGMGVRALVLTVRAQALLIAAIGSSGNCLDQDGDGFMKCQDCDDTNPNIWPGAPEICGDGIDQDCDESDLICIPFAVTEGEWTGRTDQGFPIDFTVLASEVSSIDTQMNYADYPGTCVLTNSLSTGDMKVVIADNKFTFSNSRVEIIGEFTSATTCKGTWFYENPECEGSGTGTWEAGIGSGVPGPRVKNITLSIEGNIAVVTWDPVLDANRYKVYTGSAPGVGPENHDKVYETDLPEIEILLTPGKILYFAIAVLYEGGEGPLSAELFAFLPEGGVSGQVTDSDGNPIPGATVRIDIPGSSVEVLTDANGDYAINVPSLGDFCLISVGKEGFVPATANIQKSLLDTINMLIVNFQLDRMDEPGKTVIIFEIVPEVHHLGDDKFTGSVNSQFQQVSEGITFTRSFNLTADQLPPNCTPAADDAKRSARDGEVSENLVEIHLQAKGAQEKNEVRINGHLLDTFITDSPRDGSFGPVLLPVDVAYLQEGENVLTITAIDGGRTYDDFEFANVLIYLYCDSSGDDAGEGDGDDGDDDDADSDICILADASNADYFTPHGNGVILNKINATYLIPMFAERTMGVPVTEVLSDRVIKVSGDFTEYGQERFEDVYSIEENEYVYHVHTGYNPEYDTYIVPLTGSIGDWPYFDGSDTWIYVGNREHAIAAGDLLDFFKAGTPQFSDVFLPKADQAMADEGATVRIQILLSSGENLQVRRNEEAGNDRLQLMDSDKTDEANIALIGGSGPNLFSLELVAKAFEPQSGYNDFGWEVIAENVNYYRECHDGAGNDAVDND